MRNKIVYSKETFDEHNMFYNLIRTEDFIPIILKNSIKNGLIGKKIIKTNEVFKLKNINYCVNHIDYLNVGYEISQANLEQVEMMGMLKEALVTETLKNHYGWGIPTEENIQYITSELKNGQYDGLLEVGAGSGLWSALISKRTKKQVIACDLNLRPDTPKAKYFDVKNEDAIDLIKKHKNYLILIVWPDSNDLPNKVLTYMENSNSVIFTGQIGVTANINFYKQLDNTFDLQKTSVSLSCNLNQTPFFHFKKNLNKDKKEDLFENLYTLSRPNFHLMKHLKLKN